MDEYICDDRNVIENLKKVRSMSDEEFEDYLNSLKSSQMNDSGE